METDMKIFLLVKPECRQHVELVEASLRMYALSISSAYFIPDWIPLAHKIYRHRIENEPPEFRTGFEGHLWLSSFYFGRRAIILLLESDNTADADILSIAQRANAAKQYLRDQLSYTRDGRIVTMIDLSRIDAISSHFGALRGDVGIRKQGGEFVPYGIYAPPSNGRGTLGLWEYYYFKYVHVPSPNIDEISYEWNVLTTTRTFDPIYRIDASVWGKIVDLKVFLPPETLKQISV